MDFFHERRDEVISEGADLILGMRFPTNRTYEIAYLKNPFLFFNLSFTLPKEVPSFTKEKKAALREAVRNKDMIFFFAWDHSEESGWVTKQQLGILNTKKKGYSSVPHYKRQK